MLSSGQILQNRYRIEAKLGEGGMGAVYRAYDLSLQTPCVVKEMLLVGDARQAAGAAAQFQREASTLANLRHPNLPVVTNYFQESGAYYLVMDFVEGCSLDELIPPNGLPEAGVLAYANQLLGVLEYIHSKGVLHRDIKPANIIIQPDGKAILVDFGLVKVLSEGLLSKSILHGLGTPEYAPPEQAGTGGTDQRSDLYALGATLYHALTGQPPLPAGDRTAGATLPALRQLNPSISPNTERVVLTALNLNRAQRYPSATAMCADLINQIPAALPPSAPSQTVPLHPVGNGGTPAWVLPLVVVLGLAILVLLGVIAVRELTTASGAVSAPTATSAANGVDLQNTVTPALPAATSRPPANTPTSTFTPTPDPLKITLAPNVVMEFVRVSAGNFLMGSTDSDTYASDNEKPQHTVSLEEYLIGKYEVTNAQFAAFVQATGYKTTAEQQGSGWSYTGSEWKDIAGADWRHPHGPNSDIQTRQNHPVVLISWDDAVAFCQWVTQVTGRNVQLPTETQWEKAARGTDGRIYLWGNQTPDSSRLNYNMNVKDTTPVGQYSPAGDSPYGAADMAGNVWEWVADWYNETEYKTRTASGSGVREPIGPTSGQYRVLRGGSWFNGQEGARAAGRYGYSPDFRVDLVGFRVVARSAPAPQNPTAMPATTPSATPIVTSATGNTLQITLAPDMVMEYVRVPAGNFLMGSADSDTSASSDEKPQHTVYLEEYLIGKYEVTNEQFAAFARATSRSWSLPAGKENHPVVDVSWNDAVAFCEWVSQATGRKVQLPTEAQWEKAARGTDGRIYPWGNTWDAARLNSSAGGVGATTPVGRYSPAGDSPYGAADMAGNVWEWVADSYNETEYKTRTASGSEVRDPTSPTSGQSRVLRGGSWHLHQDFARCAYRLGDQPVSRFDLVGFRVVVR
jgi:eukaryotic-like serine/threonine-protein kinase